MADLTVDAPLRFRYPNQLFVEKWVCDTSAASTFYIGNPVIIDNSEDTLYVRPWSSAVTLVNGGVDKFVGVALEHKVVVAADTEANYVISVAGPGSVVGFPSSMHVLTNASAGAVVGFHTNNGSVAAVVIACAADRCAMGYLLCVEDGYAYVKLHPVPIRTAF